MPEEDKMSPSFPSDLAWRMGMGESFFSVWYAALSEYILQYPLEKQNMNMKGNMYQQSISLSKDERQKGKVYIIIFSVLSSVQLSKAHWS